MMKIALIINLFAFTIATQSIAFVPRQVQEQIDRARRKQMLREMRERLATCTRNENTCLAGCLNPNPSLLKACRDGCVLTYGSCVQN